MKTNQQFKNLILVFVLFFISIRVSFCQTIKNISVIKDSSIRITLTDGSKWNGILVNLTDATLSIRTDDEIVRSFRVPNNKELEEEIKKLKVDTGQYAKTHTNEIKEEVKINSISLGVFSLLNQHISLGFDRAIGKNVAFTGQLGLIGPGFNPLNINIGLGSTTTSSNGAFVEAGIKLFFSPDNVVQGMHRYHVLQGRYFKPHIVFSSFGETVTTASYPFFGGGSSTTTTTHNTCTGTALLMDFGKQWIFANSVTIDIYGGIGYALYASSSGQEEGHSNYYSYITTVSSGFPLAISFGMNFGIPF